MSVETFNIETPVSVEGTPASEPANGESLQIKEEKEDNRFTSESIGEECWIKNESEDEESYITAQTSQKRGGSTTEESLVGKLRIKPFASLAGDSAPALLNRVPPVNVRPSPHLSYYVSGFNSPLMPGPSFSSGHNMPVSELNQRGLFLAHHIARIRASLNFPPRQVPLNFIPTHTQPILHHSQSGPGATNSLPVLPTAVPPTPVDPLAETSEDSKSDLPTIVPIDASNSVIKTELDLAPDVKIDPEEDVNGEIEDDTERLVLTGEEVGDQAPRTERDEFIEKSKAFFEGDGVSKYNPDGQFKCRFCYFAVSYKKQLHLHFKKHHCRENQFRCLICLIHRGVVITHSTLNELSHHVGTMHLKEKRYVCRICFKSFKSALARDSHHRDKCSTKDPYACHFCTYTCQTESILQTHLQKHDTRKRNQRMVCPVCAKTMKATAYHSHMSSHKHVYACVTCEVRFPTSTQLKKHYLKTSHQKPFRCDLCRFGAYKEELVQNHMLTAHPFKDGYTCDFPNCSKHFDSKILFNHHVKLHEKPEDQWVRCPSKDCDYAALTEVSMKLHISKTFHNRHFPCPDCTLRFSKEETLAQHIQTIHVPRVLKKQKKLLEASQSALTPDASSEPATYAEENPLADFGRGWLGISGLGVDLFNTDDQQPTEPPPDDDHYSDSDYHDVIPELSCRVECNQDDSAGSNDDPEDGQNSGNDTTYAPFPLVTIDVKEEEP